MNIESLAVMLTIVGVYVNVMKKEQDVNCLIEWMYFYKIQQYQKPRIIKSYRFSEFQGEQKLIKALKIAYHDKRNLATIPESCFIFKISFLVFFKKDTLLFWTFFVLKKICFTAMAF